MRILCRKTAETNLKPEFNNSIGWNKIFKEEVEHNAFEGDILHSTGQDTVFRFSRPAAAQILNNPHLAQIQCLLQLISCTTVAFGGIWGPVTSNKHS